MLAKKHIQAKDKNCSKI